MTVGVIRDAGYPGSPDRSDNHLACVRFLTLAQANCSGCGTAGLPNFDFHDATVLRKFGDVPDDLSAL
jgi:hypothetical protein